MAAESPPGRRTLRVLVGWSAVALNLLVSCLWAFWAAVETFHEGWYYGLLGLHLMWNLASFGPVLAAMLLGLLGLRWPRLGGLAYLLLARPDRNVERRLSGTLDAPEAPPTTAP